MLVYTDELLQIDHLYDPRQRPTMCLVLVRGNREQDGRRLIHFGPVDEARLPVHQHLLRDVECVLAGLGDTP